MLIDSHCHLDFPQFHDLTDVLQRARQAGVGHFITINTRPSKLEQLRDIAENQPDVSYTVGVHPHEASREKIFDEEKIIDLCGAAKIVAVGESGLDYHYMHSTVVDQKRSFWAHIHAAAATGLPLVIHARNADEDMIEILVDARKKYEFTPLMHCYSSGAALANVALELGAYLSFSGILTFKSAAELQQIAITSPLDRVLVETDAPYLAPVPHRGKSNEPAYIVHTAEKLAQLKNLSLTEISETTTQNCRRLFSRLKLNDKYTGRS